MTEMLTRNARRWWILVVLCLSSLVLVIDSMALTVAVPQMTKGLGASAQDTQWILDSYILVFAGLLLTSGSLGDRFGRRKVMIIGLVLFGVASLVATFAADPAQMIAVRVAMGLGGALIMPSTLSIMITVFDDAERPKAMAAWTSGRHGRPGRQPGARRGPDRALLLARDLLHQHPGGRAGHRGGPDPDARVPGAMA